MGFSVAMDQITFSEAEYQTKKRKTRREVFLVRMDKFIPWKQLEKEVARHYPKRQTGRPSYPLPTMLRVHCMQLFYNLNDPAMEDAHFLEHHGLCKVLFKEVNKHLETNGLMLRDDSIVDASIISVPSSTKNESGKRDPEMHQTRKGNQWYFGMKMHIGVDDTLGLIHIIYTTAGQCSRHRARRQPSPGRWAEGVW